MKADGMVERLLVVSLYRAIEDTAPEDLETFRPWLDPTDRRPRFHIASVIGAVGFLRKRPERCREILELAGRYASQWIYDDLSAFRRGMMKAFGWIARDVVRRRLLRGALKKIHQDAQLQLRRHGRTLVVTVPNSLFCRAGSGFGPEPTCLYYAAFFTGLLGQTERSGPSFVESDCRAQGAEACRFEAHP